MPDQIAEDLGHSSLWNMDFDESLNPFPQVNEAPSMNEGDVITLGGDEINLETLDSSGKKEVIDLWQKTNHIKKEPQAPSGFIFALQEFNYNTSAKHAGYVEKMGHTTLYDRSIDNPRAAIVASKNLSVFLDTDLTSRDCCIAKYLTGVPEMPEVYIASVYFDIDETEQIIPPNLIKCIKRCRKNNYGFLC